VFPRPVGLWQNHLAADDRRAETLTGGEIRLDGEDIGHTPAHLRNFGMVFQSLALFPHMTVGENIAYPLKLRGVSKADQQARVVELLELIQLQR
jgi:putative spermidine/putrescine transport system ATP-binding protein